MIFTYDINHVCSNLQNLDMNGFVFFQWQFVKDNLLELGVVYCISLFAFYIAVVLLWNVIYCTGRMTDNNILITVMIWGPDMQQS